MSFLHSFTLSLIHYTHAFIHSPNSFITPMHSFIHLIHYSQVFIYSSIHFINSQKHCFCILSYSPSSSCSSSHLFLYSLVYSFTHSPVLWFALFLCLFNKPTYLFSLASSHFPRFFTSVCYDVTAPPLQKEHRGKFAHFLMLKEA